ncbi:hypothetical protein KIW84_074493 [Lathyrus oleraceus]|uniref:Uncharacterized protein n=1 Tax=Pisum sativum TaxID=3888 RepID=A0A9D4ZYP1_PEA|nr:hypothetical protein KIW84_074493 [Pisum sativum]
MSSMNIWADLSILKKGKQTLTPGGCSEVHGTLNITPCSHTSTIPIESSYLLYYIIDGREIDEDRIFANKISAIAESGTKLGGKSSYPLASPGLIVVLCKKAKMHIPNQVHEVFTGVVDERYISSYCNAKPVHNLEENVANPGSGLGLERMDADKHHSQLGS